MKKILLVLFTLPVLFLKASDTLSPKSFYAQRISHAPKIDGVLDEDTWTGIAGQSDFTESLPTEGAVPAQKTEVKIAYDNSAIYVAAMLYDTRPDSILKEFGNRDDRDVNADFFRFVIDPYNTQQDAFDFAVCASGVQSDLKLSDATYDAVWNSAVKIHEQGWSVEIEIPYSAIRFPKKNIQEWGLQITRNIRRTRAHYQWALVPSGAANALKHWGLLKGIENVEAPVRLSMTPYFSAYIEQAPEFDKHGNYTYSNSMSYNVGAGIKYGINESFTIDMNLFPDFGQVQSDNKVKNLSFREVVYVENRPFFKEGTELFNKDALFYSRRVGRVPSGFEDVESEIDSSEVILENPAQTNLLNGTKLSGRTDNGLGIGFFNAVTDNMYATIQDSLGNTRKLLTEPLSNYNILVFDQQLKNASSVYVINTNVIRAQKHGHANVTGTGFVLNNKKNTLRFSGSGALSQKITPDSMPQTFQLQLGHKYKFWIEKTGGNFQYGTGYEVADNNYKQNDLGFFQVNNYRYNGAYVSYKQYKPGRFLRNSSSVFNFNYSVNYLTGKRTDLGVNAETFNTLLNWTSFWIGGATVPFVLYDYYEPRVEGRFYRASQYYYFWTGISSDYRKKLAVDLGFNLANFYKNNINGFPDLFGAAGNSTIRYRVNDRFSFNHKFNYSYDPYNPGFANEVDSTGQIIFGGRILHTITNTISAKYSFSSLMSLTLNTRHYHSTGEYVDYFELRDDGYLSLVPEYKDNHNFDYTTFNVDLVYSWQFAPGSTLSLVYKNAIEKEQEVIVHRFDETLKHTFESPQVNNVSVKVLYFLDYLYLRKKKQV